MQVVYVDFSVPKILHEKSLLVRVLIFFGLMAARLNEGRCPGGRSVSTNYITIEAVFCIKMTTVHARIFSQRVPFG